MMSDVHLLHTSVAPKGVQSDSYVTQAASGPKQWSDKDIKMETLTCEDAARTRVGWRFGAAGVLDRTANPTLRAHRTGSDGRRQAWISLLGCGCAVTWKGATSQGLCTTPTVPTRAAISPGLIRNILFLCSVPQHHPCSSSVLALPCLVCTDFARVSGLSILPHPCC
ncbi:hypothetical protein BCR34DRAFT_241588 [Clohesyomyces aquaticus]|uniref:Uncharacterized protein n=1 Tax=Clohesyomyces aquaticus TaxID=1231657 RepID=A0A1Y1ZV81_9PLEO|nr:hypothetical protein BCR34DRAFT_241588 [Clohesyomyces aquaticus]